MRFSICVLLAGVCACDAGEPPEARRGAAVIMNEAPGEEVISAAANMASERVNDLYLPGELSDENLGAGIVQRYTEIAAPYEDPITAGEAQANLDWILGRVANAPAAALTGCARVELRRQAQHVRELIERATTAGAEPPNQSDVTPYVHGRWPWGGCPHPQPPDNVRVTLADGRATVTWTYTATPAHEQFQVWQITADGPQPRGYRLDANDCGDSVANNCSTGERLLSFATGEPNVAVLVAACTGLNCTAATGAVAVPRAINDLVFQSQGGVQLQWTHVPGAEYYEVRTGQNRVVRVTDTTYTDGTARAPGGTYEYTVRACNALGCSNDYTESFRR